MIAILEAYKAGAFQSRTLINNIIAGVIVGVIALPLSMAFAIASGAHPEQGIYTAIIAGFVAGLCGGSRFQVNGPTGAFVVVLLAITTKYGIEGLQIATLMAGLILVLMGFMRLGNVIKFIPDPVIVGFTSGIALIIFVSEWKDFFGLHQVPGNLIYFHEKFLAILYAFPHLNIPTMLLGFISLVVLIFSSQFKYTRHLPAPLIALIVGITIQSVFQFSDVATIGSVYGEIPKGLPRFTLPEMSLSQIISLVGPAFTIALLGAIESLLSAVIADGMTETKHNSNQELIGQGLGNIICPFFGGFAATGAIARTALSIRHGATNPLAAVIHSATLLFIIYFMAPLAYYIPLCTLAAILFIVAYNMSDARHFYYLLRHAPKNDVLILLSTFLLTIFTDLVVAVNVGVILAILLFTRRMSQSVIIEKESQDEIELELKSAKPITLPHDVFVYSIQGPFFFAAAEKLEHTLAVIHEDPKILILRLKGVPFMDSTGLQTLLEILQDFQSRGVKVILCEANPKVSHKIENMGIFTFAHEGRMFSSLTEGLKSI
ncbi:MAG: STAS domain-containing protein [Proteobacteria bacterium]|nr:STAS domain-containing protein [Pseudomonadota bacterium]